MKKILLAVVALFIAFGASAQIDRPVTWAYAAKKTGVSNSTVFLKAAIQLGWHIYAIYSGGPSKTTVAFTKSATYKLIGKPIEPKPITKFEEAFNMSIGYFEKEVVFQQRIKTIAAKSSPVKGQLSYIACNDKKCNPPEDVNFSIPLGK